MIANGWVRKSRLQRIFFTALVWSNILLFRTARAEEAKATVDNKSREILDHWGSNPKYSDPRMDGIDMSTLLEIEDIAEPVSAYRYAAFGKPDPFVAPYDQFGQASVVAFEIPIVSPLQQSISTLRVGGIWELEDGSRRALILTQSGQGIIASVGDPIGLSGKIAEINADGVLTRQYRLRSDGSREFQDVNLKFGGKKDESHDKVLLQAGQDPIVSDSTSEKTPNEPAQPTTPGAEATSSSTHEQSEASQLPPSPPVNPEVEKRLIESIKTYESIISSPITVRPGENQQSTVTQTQANKERTDASSKAK